MLELFLLVTKAFSLLPHGNGCYQFSCNLTSLDQFSTSCVSVNHTSQEIFVSECSIDQGQSGNPFIYYSLNETQWNTFPCNATSLISTNCSAISSLYTGQQCCTDLNCISGNCVDGTCKGLYIGTACNISEECDSSTYCSSQGSCITLKQYNDSCAKDYECPIGGGCNIGQCTKLFSLPVGAEVEDSKFCQTNFLVDGYCDVLIVMLQNSPFVLYSPYMCMEGEVCEYFLSNGTLFATIDCMCAGYPDLPEGFCGLYLEFVDGVMTPVYKALQYDTSNCAGNSSHTAEPSIMAMCQSISNAQYTFYWNIYNQTKYWNIYVTGSLDECAYLFGYWDPFYSYSDYSFSSILAVTFAVFIY